MGGRGQGGLSRFVQVFFLVCLTPGMSVSQIGAVSPPWKHLCG